MEGFRKNGSGFGCGLSFPALFSPPLSYSVITNGGDIMTSWQTHLNRITEHANLSPAEIDFGKKKTFFFSFFFESAENESHCIYTLSGHAD